MLNTSTAAAADPCIVYQQKTRFNVPLNKLALPRENTEKKKIFKKQIKN